METPEFPRLAELFKSVGQPRPKNPFPPNSILHQVWSEEVRVAEEEDARLIADAQAIIDTHHYLEWQAVFWGKRFDVWAKRDIQFVQSDQQLPGFEKSLLNLADGWIDVIARSFQDAPPEYFCDVALTNIRSTLVQRVHYWKAEALRYRAEQERKPTTQRERELAAAVTPAIIARRRNAVRKYRTDHDLNAEGLARRLGMSPTAVRGVVREDRKRFSTETRTRLLMGLAISIEDWYRE